MISGQSAYPFLLRTFQLTTENRNRYMAEFIPVMSTTLMGLSLQKPKLVRQFLQTYGSNLLSCMLLCLNPVFCSTTPSHLPPAARGPRPGPQIRCSGRIPTVTLALFV